MNNLDNPYSGMINLMREQGAKFNAPNLLVGEVVNADPIKIKVSDVILDKDNLYIADYLMPNYKRKYKIVDENISFSTSNLTAPTNTRTFSHSHATNSHSHTVTAGEHSGSTNSVSTTTDTNNDTHGHAVTSISLNASNLNSDGEIILTNSGLSNGDVVAIQQLSNSSKFIVYCKLI